MGPHITEIVFALLTQRTGSNPGSAEIFSLLHSSWAVERSCPSSADPRDFANAVSGNGLG